MHKKYKIHHHGSRYVNYVNQHDKVGKWFENAESVQNSSNFDRNRCNNNTVEITVMFECSNDSIITLLSKCNKDPVKIINTQKLVLWVWTWLRSEANTKT